MKKIFKNQIALALAGILAGSSAVAGTLVINGDTSDPAPKAAFQAVIDGFEAENPDVDVVYNLAFIFLRCASVRKKDAPRLP